MAEMPNLPVRSKVGPIPLREGSAEITRDMIPVLQERSVIPYGRAGRALMRLSGYDTHKFERDFKRALAELDEALKGGE